MFLSKLAFYNTKEKVKLRLDSTQPLREIFATKKEFYVDYNDFSEFCCKVEKHLYIVLTIS